MGRFLPLKKILRSEAILHIFSEKKTSTLRSDGFFFLLKEILGLEAISSYLPLKKILRSEAILHIFP